MRYQNILLISFLAVALSACGGSDFAEPTTTIEGIVSDDPLDGATVEILDLSGTVLDSTTTGTDGFFSVDVDESLIEGGYELVASGDILRGEAPAVLQFQ